ncbi:ArsR/SmtB family transcription factor, partial [Halobium palmae]
MDDATPESTDPADAFAALSDPARVAILRALWETDSRDLSFSELRAAVGVDDSGRFNYHVGKLTDRFVRKTEDGYRLRLAGIRVLGAIFSGVVTEDGSVEPLPFEEPCPLCDGPMTFSYENEYVSVTCDDCDRFSMRYPVPPGVFTPYDRAELPRIAESYARSMLARADDGFCSICEGHLVPALLPGSETTDLGEWELDDVPFVVYTCERCGQRLTSDLGVALLSRPLVAGFFYDRGVDVRDAPLLSFVAAHE